MEALVFIKQHNALTYDSLGGKKFSFLPREGEFISVQQEGSKVFFQVIAIHHVTEPKIAVEIYAVQTEPTWEFKKKGSIGFSF